MKKRRQKYINFIIKKIIKDIRSAGLKRLQGQLCLSVNHGRVIQLTRIDLKYSHQYLSIGTPKYMTI